MFKTRILKATLSTMMALSLAVTPIASVNLNAIAKTATTDAVKNVETKQETLPEYLAQENSYIRFRTTYLNFTITSSSGKYAVVEGGKKAKGDLEILDLGVYEGTSIMEYNKRMKGKMKHFQSFRLRLPGIWKSHIIL